ATRRKISASLRRLESESNYFFHRFHVVELDVADLLALQVLADVDFVLERDDDFANAAAFRGEHFFLDAADGEDLAGQGDFAGHRQIAAHAAVGQHGKQRGCHRDSGAGAILGNGAGGDVDVDGA